MECSTPGFPVHHQRPDPAQTQVCRSVMPSNHLILCHNLLLLPSIFPSFRVQWVGASHQVAEVLELQLQHQSFQWIIRTDFLYNWLVWSSCSPRDSQEHSPTPLWESISSTVFRLLYGPILIPVRDYWKTYGFGYMNLCWQCKISAF